jgi:hypothetical protein
VSVGQAGVPTTAQRTRTAAAAAGATVQGVRPCAWVIWSRAAHEHSAYQCCGCARLRSMWRLTAH